MDQVREREMLILKTVTCQAGQSKAKLVISIQPNRRRNLFKAPEPHLDVVLQVEEERQLEAMLWPKFSDGRHSA